jgi:hypothetical protein
LKKPEMKISERVAEDQVNLLLDYYDIELADINNDAQRDAVESALTKLRRGVRRGLLEIKEQDGLKVTQILRNQEKIEYCELDGRAKLAMKNKKDTDGHGRIFAIMGYLSGLGESAIICLKANDLSIVECLGVIFLLS